MYGCIIQRISKIKCVLLLMPLIETHKLQILESLIENFDYTFSFGSKQDMRQYPNQVNENMHSLTILTYICKWGRLNGIYKSLFFTRNKLYCLEKNKEKIICFDYVIMTES